MTHEQETTLPNDQIYEELRDKFALVGKQAKEMIDLWRGGSKDIIEKVNVNGLTDVVTQVEREIEILTASAVQELIPGTPLLGEESFHDNYHITEADTFVVIDPVDGTRQFISGSDEWSISICAVNKGQPVVGMVYMPDKNELYMATKGKGVLLNDIPLNDFYSSRTQPPPTIAVSPRQIREENYGHKVLNTGLTPIGVASLTPKIGALLRGESQAAVYFPQAGQSASLWDYAAAYFLLEEAGGKMTSLTGEPLPFKGEGIIHREGWLAVANAKDYQRYLDSLKIE